MGINPEVVFSLEKQLSRCRSSSQPPAILSLKEPKVGSEVWILFKESVRGLQSSAMEVNISL